jgi:class 3 adenylate cyclase
MSGTTSLFTDIVDSTEKAVELGDRGWAELLERHHSIVRAQLSRFYGQEMDTSGDGFFAIFPDPGHAIGAARSIQANLRELDLKVRIGIHAGDCWVADGKCTGLAIHIGARIAALARPEEILLSEAAKAEAGSTYHFADRGETSLKGVPGRWHLYALASSPSPDLGADEIPGNPPAW